MFCEPNLFCFVFVFQLDLNDMKQFKNPEEFLKVSKKGKTLMIFVKVIFFEQDKTNYGLFNRFKDLALILSKIFSA